jgi:hypothetical protein
LRHQNNDAVSHVIGYILALSITAMAVSATILLTSNSILSQTDTAAGEIAKNIAAHVADAIINARTIKENYISANYSRILDIPLFLIDQNRMYYIEIGKKNVWVNSSDGRIHESATLHNTSEVLCADVSGKIYGSTGIANITTTNTEYKYKFDFGQENTSAPFDSENSFIRVTDNCSMGSLPSKIQNIWLDPNKFEDWHYCTPINITNPTEKNLRDYQIMIKLDPSYFDYSTANYNGSDLRFVDKNGKVLSYWIEIWNPFNTSTSRVWVNVSDIPKDGCIIFMFHGNECASPRSNGDFTFLFFDDFSEGSVVNTSKWNFVTDGDFSDPGNNWVEIKNDIILLRNLTALKTKIVNITETGIVEAKAKAVGEPLREASIFVRENTTRDGANPDCAFVFSSGNFSGTAGGDIKENLAVLFKTGNPPLLGSYGENYGYFDSLGRWIDTEWKRLVFIVNYSEYNDYVVSRYNYEDYSLEGYALWNDETLADGQRCKVGKLGICTLHDTAKGYYDWIFLRKYAMNISEKVQTTEEQIPTGRLNGTISKDYFQWWPDNDDVDSSYQHIAGKEDEVDPLSYDFVWGTSSKTFRITNLDPDPDKEYSVVFVMGNIHRTIDDVQIRANGVLKKTITIDTGKFKKDWFVTTAPGGILDITFDDPGGGSEDYWNICWMTIEENKRQITLTGGD